MMLLLTTLENRMDFHAIHFWMKGSLIILHLICLFLYLKILDIVVKLIISYDIIIKDFKISRWTKSFKMMGAFVSCSRKGREICILVALTYDITN